MEIVESLLIELLPFIAIIATMAIAFLTFDRSSKSFKYVIVVCTIGLIVVSASTILANVYANL